MFSFQYSAHVCTVLQNYISKSYIAYAVVFVWHKNGKNCILHLCLFTQIEKIWGGKHNLKKI